jgi:hypothetical protein
VNGVVSSRASVRKISAVFLMIWELRGFGGGRVWELRNVPAVKNRVSWGTVE